MSTEFQSSIQTLSELYEKSQQQIRDLENERAELQSQVEVVASVLEVSQLQAVDERAAADGVSVDVWLKDIIMTAIDKDVRAVYLDKRAYDGLRKLAESRNIDIDLLMTRSGVTDFILSAIQNGRL